MREVLLIYNPLSYGLLPIKQKGNKKRGLNLGDDEFIVKFV